jgi:hypothetical protein
MSLPWRPRIDFGATTVQLELPQRPWTLAPVGVGGHRVSGAGVPATYQLRRDQRARLGLRAYEHELQALFDWIAYAQSPPFQFYFWFDRSDATTRYSCYLDAPVMGEEIVPEREESGAVHVVPVTIRAALGTAFSVRYYGAVQ